LRRILPTFIAIRRSPIFALLAFCGYIKWLYDGDYRRRGGLVGAGGMLRLLDSYRMPPPDIKAAVDTICLVLFQVECIALISFVTIEVQTSVSPVAQQYASATSDFIGHYSISRHRARFERAVLMPARRFSHASNTIRNIASLARPPYEARFRFDYRFAVSLG
jgi:hypothetical protein